MVIEGNTQTKQTLANHEASIYLIDAGSMLGHRLSRWPTIETTLPRCHASVSGSSPADICIYQRNILVSLRQPLSCWSRLLSFFIYFISQLRYGAVYDVNFAQLGDTMSALVFTTCYK